MQKHLLRGSSHEPELTTHAACMLMCLDMAVKPSETSSFFSPFPLLHFLGHHGRHFSAWRWRSLSPSPEPHARQDVRSVLAHELCVRVVEPSSAEPERPGTERPEAQASEVGHQAGSSRGRS